MTADDRRASLIEVTLDERLVKWRSAEVEHERKVAIYDLLEENRFTLVGGVEGPYRVHLAIEDNRLIFDIRDDAGAPLDRVPLPLLQFRKIVKDYFQVCESYYDAIKRASPSRIEAIDMGRRGLHNEGSALLRERLAGRIEIDHDTSRRLFTLLCVLHIRA
ncbi:MAG TPA: UPF0262 family protein [Alphaproteobacteria bacterium]|nr:UPF0262 family protein [Alphaproteobacteria bacterium]